MLANYKSLGVWSVAKIGGGAVNIIPGVNDIDDNDWKGIKDHPTVKDRIGDDTLVLLKADNSEGKKKQLDGMPETLEGMNAGGAIDFIGGIFDIDQLKAWKKKENRGGVSAAIDKQIKSIRAAANVDLGE